MQRFHDLLANRDLAGFTRGISDVTQQGNAELIGFVAGLQQDRDAVDTAFTSRWSQGHVEGQGNRIKTLTRSMYGRAKFDVLRQRVLHGVYSARTPSARAPLSPLFALVDSGPHLRAAGGGARPGLGADPVPLARLLRIWRREGFAWNLRGYRQRYGFGNADLAAYLQMLESKLDLLYQGPQPDRESPDYRQHTDRLAEAADANPERLRALLADVARADQPVGAQEAPSAPHQSLPWETES